MRVRVTTVLFSALGLLVSAGFFAGCAEKAADSSSSPAPTETKTNRQTYRVRGVIQELRPERKEVVIKHEAITNYMDAMTMPFEVKSTNELTGLSSNDLVSFTMIVTER